jgi:hypothetical protein
MVEGGLLKTEDAKYEDWKELWAGRTALAGRNFGASQRDVVAVVSEFGLQGGQQSRDCRLQEIFHKGKSRTLKEQ